MASAFTEQVYRLACTIPRGQVASYGQLAAMAGHLRASRVVGGMLCACKRADVPCHRVVRKDGSLALQAFEAPGLQRHLLESEGVAFTLDGRVDMAVHRWKP